MQQTIFTSKYFDNKLRSFDIKQVKNLEYKQQILQRWISAIKNDTLKFSKETQIDITFLNDIFGEVLEYDYHIDKSKINLVPKSSIESKEPDAILGFFERTNHADFESPQGLKRDIRVVIELKDSKIDLDRVQNRLEKISPVTQAFEYARKAGEQCKWVIVSNIQTIRLYNKESDNYELFNLVDLQDEYYLKRFFYLLHKDRLIFTNGDAFVDKLYIERQEEELKITKEFYQNYKEIRIKLFKNLKENNPKIDKLILLEKAQKLLDRIIFICFCSDLEILPVKMLQNIATFFTTKDFFYNDTSLWFLLKEYFETIDKGNNKIAKLNGGLFAKDNILDNLKIGSEILLEVFKLSNFDYRSDLNINILGHIFEQSISDLEKLKQNITNPAGFENPQGLTNGKRKEFGVFYTPDYITKYIVKESIGGWLSDIRSELGENELPILTDKDYEAINFAKVSNFGKVDKIEKNKKFWNDYLQKLLSIKVLDPACGSGAFLVAAYDFLLKEYLLIQKEIALLNPPEPPENFIPKMKNGLDFELVQKFDIENHIIKNNIYGVDLNFESVEITKLSLWLKTVKRGKILGDIDYNIQCGNSLIQSKEIAGDWAFEWNEKYKKIMESGGFDVIIGNPPYVNIELVDEKSRKFLLEKYETCTGRTDLYIAFMEKSIELLNQNGYNSFIIPYSFINQNYGSVIRKKLVENTTIKSLSDLSNFYVFPDAKVKNIVYCVKKSYEKTETDIRFFNNMNDFFSNHISHYHVNQSEFLKLKENRFETKNIYSVLDIKEKIESQSVTLDKICLVAMGVRVHNDKQKIDKQYFIKNSYSNGLKPYLEGKNIERYIYTKGQWLDYKPTEHNNPMFPELFENEKIMAIRIVKDRIRFSYDTEMHYNSHTVVNCVRYDNLEKATHVSARSAIKKMDIEFVKQFDYKYLLLILNSKLINWYFLNFLTDGINFYPNQIKSLPIKNISLPEQQPFIEYADLMLTKKSELQKISKEFTNYLSAKYSINNLSKNLINWYKISDNQFLTELTKLKVNISHKDESNFLQYFNEQKQIASKIDNEIEIIDNKIDELIYKLYKLSNNEIEKIV